MRKPIRIVLLGILTLTPAVAHAISCTITTNANASFGSYSVNDASPSLTSGTVTLNCTSVLGSDNITIDLSKGGAASYSPRLLSGPGVYTLAYNLYMDAPRTIIWGDNTGGSQHYGPTNPPNGTDVPLTVYGQVPAHQNVAAGAYTDAIVVTVNF